MNNFNGAMLAKLAAMLIATQLTQQSVQAQTLPLRQAAEQFAGAPVHLDPRIPVPACAAYNFAWRDERRAAILASCAGSGWRMVLPISRSAASTSSESPAAIRVIKRGDPVQVRIAGDGFRMLADGVAMGNAGPGGRVLVRNLSSGRQLVAAVMADGSLELAGNNF